MDQRLDLQKVLEDILDSPNVYFQPDVNTRLKYPAIVYQLSSDSVRRADNLLYFRKKRYSITVIDRNPDSLIPDKIIELPLSSLIAFLGLMGLIIFNTIFSFKE